MNANAATTADAAAAVIGGTLIGLLLFAGFYIWLALALSAVFGKSGVEPFKAWVPILNSVVLLQLAGLSPWFLVLAFIPLANIVFLVVWIMALYRLSVAFGYGVGMTVLGALLFPVWASVIGWGTARWVGREAPAGVRRSAGGAAEEYTPLLPPGPAGSAAPAPVLSDAFGFAPEPSAPSAADSAPPVPEVSGFAPQPVSAVPTAAAPAAPAIDADDSGSAITPPPGGWTPPPLPGAPAPAAAAAADLEAPEADGPDQTWQGFALDSAGVGADASAEVTGAVIGAPTPISAVRPSEPIPLTPDAFAAADPSTTSGGITRPPVTRVPAPQPSDEREPWAPARSPLSDADAFPETSGPVSAVAGAPDAGAPRSARTSVSAFHTRPEIPEDIEEETIIARRKRTEWSLLPPTGDPVPLSGSVVILGRRPTADPEYPGAQLISIHDGTVSRNHALLQLRDDRWYVTDLDSTNGVLFATLMGTEVEAPPRVEVEAGDRFLLGDAEIRLQRSDA